MESASKRAQDLLAKMTVAEKVGQLNQHLYGFRIYEREGEDFIFTQEFRDEVEKYSGLGTVYGLYRADPWSEKNYENGITQRLSVKAYNQMQKYVLDHSRLGIPVLLSTECPHGHQALDGYLLPVNLAVGATFAPELLEEAGKVCGEQLAGMGVNLALVSTLDILRDPRWGRSEECFSEDPYLASEFAKAIVNGIQSKEVGVVAKHFCGQGETTGGINASAARIGERELNEIHLPAAKACCEARVMGVMAAYNEIDGIYCHGNKELLNDTLREEFGFEGVVMADGVAIDQLNVMTGDTVKSAALALKSGVDISLWDEAFTRLEEALMQGLITEEDLDLAVLRVLELKFKMGLFDKPYLDSLGNRTSVYGEDESKLIDFNENPASEQLSAQSPVLLKNDGILPLGKEKRKLALIGPNADDLYRQIGDYSPPFRPGVGKTLLQGMQDEFKDFEIFFSDGFDIEEARNIASIADITILALGGSSSRFAGADFDINGAAKVDKNQGYTMDCGEGMDLASLNLPDGQSQLFHTIRQVAKKIVTVIIAGRPYAIEEIAEESDALLYAFYPGPMGGKALAKLLSGNLSPAGRLPVSIPRKPGQVPVYYNHTKSYPAMKYCDVEAGALYSFGQGMGYGQLFYEGVEIRREKKDFRVSGLVTNQGAYKDYAVAQVYRSVMAGELAPRERELVAFKKYSLEPGESRSFEIIIPEDRVTNFYDAGKKIFKVDLFLMDQGQEIKRESF